ncbi:MAG: lipoyl(octanoyl) transferase LipB, partial [Desulfohalobiaceae bacterium]|nr:lipoyl(octanoyl) transferase LipB [Desulfohalobiaceae bacterium]
EPGTKNLERATGKPRPCLWRDFGLINYEEARKLQLGLVEDKYRDRTLPEIIMTLEHYPVFTLGRQGKRDSLLVSDDYLQENGVALCQAERGGDITYHGPGQLVVYPIFDLRRAGLRLTELVHGLEEAMLETAAEFGVTAERNSRNRGVWVGGNKLGSIGLAVRRGIAYHGLAFNVCLDLAPFAWINPCGLQGVTMTSLEQAARKPVPMDAVRERIKEHLGRTFHLQEPYENQTQALLAEKEAPLRP